MEQIKITACAKINLSLSVLGKREDGYHELDTVMQSVDLSDTVYIEKYSGIITDCKGISAEENIAARAARLFCKKTGAEGCKIKIEKRIPAAAGLGGGSADAAAEASRAATSLRNDQIDDGNSRSGILAWLAAAALADR